MWVGKAVQFFYSLLSCATSAANSANSFVHLCSLSGIFLWRTLNPSLFSTEKNLCHKQGPLMLTYSVFACASVCSLLYKTCCWIVIWSLAKRGTALRATDLVKPHLYLGKVCEPCRFSRSCSSAIHLRTWQPTIHFAWQLSVSLLCVTLWRCGAECYKNHNAVKSRRFLLCFPATWKEIWISSSETVPSRGCHAWTAIQGF